VVPLVERWTQANQHIRQAGLFTPWPFPTVVIDEAQDFKDCRANRTRALFKIRHQVSRMIQLTGSPTPQDIADLWSQVFLLDGGASLGDRFVAFRSRFFRVTQTIFDKRGHLTPVKWEPVDGALEQIHAACAHLAMSADVAVTVTPPVIKTRLVSIPPDVRQLYDELKRELIVELATDQTITADNAGVLRARLLQLASGTCYPVDSDAKRREVDYISVHDAKIEALAEIVHAADTPVMVAYRFRSDSTRIPERLADLGIHAEVFDGSPDMVERWNNGLVPVMLIQPASSGRGLNLQDGGRHLVWFTLPDSSEHYSQTNGRLARLGQTKQVEITLLVCEGTIDEVLHPRLLNKLGSQAELLRAATEYSLAQASAVLKNSQTRPARLSAPQPVG
jgi:SNF2 family DNA or RNA helicase